MELIFQLLLDMKKQYFISRVEIFIRGLSFKVF